MMEINQQKHLQPLPNAPAFDGLQDINQPSGTDGLTQLTLDWNVATGAFNRYRIFSKSRRNIRLHSSRGNSQSSNNGIYRYWIND